MEFLRDYTSKEISRDEGLAWEVFLQGLDVTSSELVDGAMKECKNPSTLHEGGEACGPFLLVLKKKINRFW